MRSYRIQDKVGKSTDIAIVTGGGRLARPFSLREDDHMAKLSLRGSGILSVASGFWSFPGGYPTCCQSLAGSLVLAPKRA